MPRDYVKSLDTFLSERKRVWSMERSRLTRLFYGRELARLHASKVREMKRTLSGAGIAFEPESWPKSHTRIRLWKDASFVRTEAANSAIAGLLPQWHEPFVLPSGSRDPLGLQASAERLVNEALPGLTVFTFRAGYYGFLPWAIAHANSLARDEVPRGWTRREVVNALERALVLCEFVYHGRDDDSCVLIGQRSKIRVLSSSDGDRFHVPDSILKNQNSAGSFRLFATSLVSLGLVEEAEELAADGLLPYRLTDLGKTIASSFERHLDPGLTPFAMGRRTETRRTLYEWGRHACFSTIARKGRLRETLLDGLLLGKSGDAGKRYATASHLLAERLLGGDAPATAADGDVVSEDQAAVQEEDPQGASVSNLDVFLRFYDREPRPELRPLQAVSVFELLALGLSTVFRAALVGVTASGRIDIGRLSASIATVTPQATVWSSPMRTAKPSTVRRLVRAILTTEDPVGAASLGGALLLRVLKDPMLATVWDTLCELAQEPVDLVDAQLRQRMDSSLADALPRLLSAMAERHEVVSQRKGRQRWLFVEDNAIKRDDPREMGLGLHALRFPQFGSIARDIGLSGEDLHGD